MAEKLETTAKSDAPDAAVTKDWLERLDCARNQKSLVEKDLQEAYFFTRPRLARDVGSRSAPSKALSDEASDLATGIGSEVSEDFATEVVAAFFPPTTQWVVSSTDAAILAGANAADIEAFGEAVKGYDKSIFAAINSSNFNAELGVALDPDASIGTIGLWIEAPGGGRPYKVEHVPTRELEFDLDPDGNPGNRFRVRFVQGSKLRALIGEVAIDAKTEAKIKRQPKAIIEVAWGFGRDWSKPLDDVYEHVLLVDKIVVHHQELRGEGSVALIIARFSPDKLHSWGNGSAIKSLPEMRVLDAITAATQDRVDIATAPPFGFPDDGVMNFAGGLEAGKGYPMRPGSGRDIVKLYFEGNADLGFYTIADLEKKVRRKFFADYPEQKGDTPPTATQWIDEMVRSQRRIGTPGAKFWEEGPYQIYRRFEYLLKADGRLKPVELDGVSASLSANNPATQAQNNQKLQVASQLLAIIKTNFPMTSQAAIDELRTIENMQKLVRDEVIVLRDPDKVEEFIQQILSSAQAQQQGGAPADGQNPAQ